MTRFHLTCVAVVVAATTSAGTARADVESGPKVGEKVPALKVFGVVGSVEGKEADFVADRKDGPTVFVFVQSEHWSRPAARFIKVADDQLADVDGAAVVAVWLGDKKADEHKEYLPKAQKSLGFERTSLAVFEGDKSGPAGWGVNADAHLTVVVVAGGTVAKSVGFESVNETDLNDVVAALKKAAGK